MAKLKGNISISKDSEGVVNIRVQDEESRAHFIDIEMTKEEFADALFGLAARPVEFTLDKVERVGKRKVTQSIKLEMPLKDYSYGEEKRKMAKEIILRFALKQIEETGKGWVADLYLRSQTTFTRVGDREYVNTTMSYWG